MKAFFKELLEYSHHTNQKLIGNFDENKDKVTERSARLLNHILNAQHIWNSRIDPKGETCGVWDIHPPANLKKMDTLNYEHSCTIIDTFDPDKMISYTNSRGQAFQNTVKDILFHVINHSTYHRAQIATDFKHNGLEPLVSDYIFYKRQDQRL